MRHSTCERHLHRSSTRNGETVHNTHQKLVAHLRLPEPAPVPVAAEAVAAVGVGTPAGAVDDGAVGSGNGFAADVHVHRRVFDAVVVVGRRLVERHGTQPIRLSILADLQWVAVDSIAAPAVARS